MALISVRIEDYKAKKQGEMFNDIKFICVEF